MSAGTAPSESRAFCLLDLGLEVVTRDIPLRSGPNLPGYRCHPFGSEPYDMRVATSRPYRERARRTVREIRRSTIEAFVMLVGGGGYALRARV